LGIKKTDLDQEKRYELISEVKFRMTEIYNPKDPEEEKRKFDLPDMVNEREVKAKVNILKCLFLDRFTFLDYIQGGCEIGTIIGMEIFIWKKLINLRTLTRKLLEKQLSIWITMILTVLCHSLATVLSYRHLKPLCLTVLQ